MNISQDMAKLFIICVLAVSLSACSSMSPNSNSASTLSISPPNEVATSVTSNANLSKENIPNLTLTDEIVFKIISAEIAFQRGDFPAAFATTMAVAQQTRDPRLAKRALEMALLSKQPLQGFIASRLWHEYSPDSDEATQYFLGFLIINNNFADVYPVISHRLAIASTKERGLILLQTQRLLMRAADKQAAFKLLEELCKPYPDYLETHLALSQAAFASNNSIRSMVEARKALSIQPESQIAVLALAQASPAPVAALTVLSEFLIKYPTAQEVRRAYAGMLVEQKQFSEARSQFETLEKSNPQDPTILFALGVVALQLKDTTVGQQKLKEFLQIIENTPNAQHDPTTAYLYLSQIADDRHDGETALNWLSKIQSYNGKNANYFNAQLRQAILIEKYKSPAQARQFLHEIKANPEEQIQLIELESELLHKENRNEEALALLQEAIKTHPDNPDLLYDFAMMAEKLNRLADMEKALRRVIEINPKSQQAYNALGYSLADRNVRLTEARKLLEKALSLAPDDAYIIDSMGWLHFRENKNESALTLLQRAYTMRPDADIAVHLGEVLWAMGEQQKAKAIWKEAKLKDPANTALKNTLDRLKIDF